MRFSIPGMPIRTIPGGSLVEDRSHMLEAVHLEAISLMHED
jgi:hypothetical protein